MGGFRHTGVGAASARTHYAVVGGIQDSLYNWIAGGGAADAITAAYSPAVTALVDGMELNFRAAAANATTTPTFAPNGLTARTITKLGGGALVVGDIKGNLAEYSLRYNLANTRWELMNPSRAAVAQGGTGVASATAYAVLCGGTTSTAALQSIAGVGTSGQVLTSNGAGALPTFQAANGKIATSQVTDATDITLSQAPTQANIGSTVSLTIPTKGMIQLFFTGEVIWSTGANGLVIGIRIGSTNYWPNDVGAGYLSGYAIGAAFTGNINGYGGDTAGSVAGSGGSQMTGLSIEGASVPTGAQTVQVIVGKLSGNTAVVKGTVVTSIINIVVIDCT